MTQTILETFCFENQIPFMKTDHKVLRKTLSTLHSSSQLKKNTLDCILIMKPINLMAANDENQLVSMIIESEIKNETFVVLNSQSPTSELPPSSIADR
jgi:hypothetical protein